jgi:urea transport system ATP-binding protein
MTTLTVDDIHLHYGAAEALRGVSLRAEPAAITCVLGRNGVGKTSLLRAVTGQQAITSGSVNFKGEPMIRQPPYARAANGMAIVPQGREIFPLLTVEENLQTGFACLERRKRSIPAEVFELFPVLETMLQRRGGDLSGGQQQQLAIGRALVTRPELLILDEPTEGIQPSIIKDIGRALAYLRDTVGLTILLVEQYLDFCRELADKVYIMDRGEIVHDGSAADLDDENVRRHLMV